MADKKVSELVALATPASGDLLLIIDDPGGTPVSKKISLKTLFGAVPANTVFAARVTAQANVSITGSNTNITANLNSTGLTSVTTLKLLEKSTPANSTITIKQGRMWFDANYIYVAVANNVVKRANLNSF